MYVVGILLLYALLSWEKIAAQCNGTVDTYPYEQDFEGNNGGWTTGGNASDWAWGSPNKKIVKTAASGAKCWITGGLTGNAYNSNEGSYLQSPCFVLTDLNIPYLRFKLFCDTEQDWDGANLQYSPDNGVTWIKIGFYNQPVDCINSGWYNNPNIHFLASGDGWSGANATNGKWTVAQIRLPFTGGTGKKVMFRFYFGAGSKNNNYDGFGIDDFHLAEAPTAAGLSFDYSCIDNTVVQFNANASPCLSNLQWNFGDATSGADNTSGNAVATHHFLTTGNHVVTLTAKDNNGNTVTATSNINIINTAIDVLSMVLCPGGTAKVKAVVQGDNNIPYQYTWSTSPETTTAMALLPAGNFKLVVSGNNTCPAESQITLSEPAPIAPQLIIQQPDCNNNNGSINVVVAGGAYPFTYSWQPAVSTNADAQQLQEGIYQVKITDNNGCTTTASATLQAATLQLHLGEDTTLCYGQNFMLHAGNYSTYVWDDLSNAPQRTIDKPGVYFITVTNEAGCTASDTIQVISDCGDVYFPSAFTPNGDFINDQFGPAGNIGLLKNYSLRVYNRLGNIVFNSVVPAQKWNGKAKNGGALAGTYIYIAVYEYNGIKKTQQGTLVLLQ